MRDLNRIQTLFSQLIIIADIQATVAIARVTLTIHSEYGDLHKKRYLWKSSYFLGFFGCEDSKTMITRKTIQESTVDYFANYPSAIKKRLWRTEEKK